MVVLVVLEWDITRKNAGFMIFEWDITRKNGDFMGFYGNYVVFFLRMLCSLGQ